MCDSRDGGPVRRSGPLCEDKTVFTVRPDLRLDIGKPGAWRGRLRSRLQIERSLVGSALLHLLALLALVFLMEEQQPSNQGASNPVTVIFEPSPPSSRRDLPPGQAATSAPEEGPQVAPPLGTRLAEPAPAPLPPMPREMPQAGEMAVAEPLRPIPPPPVPPAPAPPEAVPAPAIPTPPVPSSAEPGPVPPPPLALALPVPPKPSPPVPIRPRAERSPPAAPSVGGSLSAPMNYSFGAPTSEPSKSRPTGRKNTLDPTLGPEVRDAVGSPPTDIHRPDASIKVTGAQVGTDWIMQLHEWWDQHGYYPNQAAFRGEDGTVKVHVVMNRFGKVLGVELTGRSGSQWLDLAAVGVFRDAKLPPFPPSTPEGRAELDLTINYILYR